MGKIIKGLVIIFGLLFLIGLLGGSPDDQTTSYDEGRSSESASAKSPQTSTPDYYSIGDRVVVGDIAYTVTRMYTAQSVGNDMFGDKADGIFIIVDMKLENLGKESMTISSDYVKAIDSQARVFESDSGAWIHLEDNIFLKQLQPGLPSTGQAIFDVPPGESITLEVTDGLWSSKKALIRIGNT